MPLETVLLTGATGFVGTHAAEAFAAQGVTVRAIVRHTSDTTRLRQLGATVIAGSLTDADVVVRAAAGADSVVHMAALTRARSQAEYDAVNDLATRALLRALGRAAWSPRRFVYLSSLAAAGPSAEAGVAAGTAPRPLTAYGRSKLGGEVACAEEAGSFETVIIRAPAVYGPRDRDLLPFFRLAQRGLLPVPGRPDRRLQLVHVQDLAHAVVNAATLSGVSGVYHVAEPRSYTWAEVLELVAAAVGRRGRTLPLPASALRAAAAVSEWGAGLVGRATIFNRDKAEELLAPGWLCDTEPALRDLAIAPRSLADGLADTARWYRDHGWL